MEAISESIFAAFNSLADYVDALETSRRRSRSRSHNEDPLNIRNGDRMDAAGRRRLRRIRRRRSRSSHSDDS